MPVSTTPTTVDKLPSVTSQALVASILSTFSGQNGHQYGFYCVATDIAGNIKQHVEELL